MPKRGDVRNSLASATSWEALGASTRQSRNCLKKRATQKRLCFVSSGTLIEYRVPSMAPATQMGTEFSKSRISNPDPRKPHSHPRADKFRPRRRAADTYIDVIAPWGAPTPHKKTVDVRIHNAPLHADPRMVTSSPWLVMLSPWLAGAA